MITQVGYELHNDIFPRFSVHNDPNGMQQEDENHPENPQFIGEWSHINIFDPVKSRLAKNYFIPTLFKH